LIISASRKPSSVIAQDAITLTTQEFPTRLQHWRRNCSSRKRLAIVIVPQHGSRSTSKCRASSDRVWRSCVACRLMWIQCSLFPTRFNKEVHGQHRKEEIRARVAASAIWRIYRGRERKTFGYASCHWSRRPFLRVRSQDLPCRTSCLASHC